MWNKYTHHVHPSIPRTLRLASCHIQPSYHSLPHTLLYRTSLYILATQMCIPSHTSSSYTPPLTPLPPTSPSSFLLSPAIFQSFQCSPFFSSVRWSTWLPPSWLAEQQQHEDSRDGRHLCIWVVPASEWVGEWVSGWGVSGWGGGEWVGGWVSGWVSGWVRGEWMSEWVGGWVSGWVSGWMLMCGVLMMSSTLNFSFNPPDILTTSHPTYMYHTPTHTHTHIHTHTPTPLQPPTPTTPHSRSQALFHLQTIGEGICISSALGSVETLLKICPAGFVVICSSAGKEEMGRGSTLRRSIP